MFSVESSQKLCTSFKTECEKQCHYTIFSFPHPCLRLLPLSVLKGLPFHRPFPSSESSLTAIKFKWANNIQPVNFFHLFSFFWKYMNTFECKHGVIIPCLRLLPLLKGLPFHRLHLCSEFLLNAIQLKWANNIWSVNFFHLFLFPEIHGYLTA